MIEDNLSNSTDSEPADDDDALAEISKSQRKRDASAIRDLGSRLCELSPGELATIPVPEDVVDAIRELARLKANGARKRQLGFLAKRLRNVEIAPIDAALQELSQKARANTLSLHRVEQWRDRLLGDLPDESANDALTQFLHEYSAADRQQLRQLQRQAIKERSQQRPPAAARLLFKAIRDIVNTA